VEVIMRHDYQPMREAKVWIIECSVRGSRTWEELTPGVRYSYSDLMCFQDDLTWEDSFCTIYRARPMDGFGDERLSLRADGYTDDADPFVHLRTALDVAGGEVLPPTGWTCVLHQLGIVEAPVVVEMRSA